MSRLAFEAIEPWGPAASGRRPLVLLHGFTQTRRSWGELARRLAERRPCVLVDLPGHGASADIRADLPASADLVAELLDSSEAGMARDGTDVLGYSLGARLALQLAVAHSTSLGRLVLLSGTAGIEDPVARDARRRRDDALADRLESGADLDAFLREWLAAPMFATLRQDAAAFEERGSNTPAGLAASLRLAGTGAQESLWARLPSVRIPTLVVTGATDHRFTSLGRRLSGLLPVSSLAVVPGAGHAVHLEQPALVTRLVDAWLGAKDR